MNTKQQKKTCISLKVISSFSKKGLPESHVERGQIVNKQNSAKNKPDWHIQQKATSPKWERKLGYFK